MTIHMRIWGRELLALLVFLACLTVGAVLAQRRPLWNDELYTQVYTIERHSYGDILSTNFIEGQICPLYYLLQKGICDLLGYHFPHGWEGGEVSLSEPGAQRVMRIAPNLFMSSSLAMIFYFFTRFISLPLGIYALSLCLSSFMVWAYWVEARHYSLWFFLTTVQILCFFHLLRPVKIPHRVLHILTATHVLLPLTTILSLPQILIASFLLWLFKERDWRRYIFLTLIPGGLCIFYFLRSPLLTTYRLVEPWKLLQSAFPPEWGLLLVVYGLIYLGRGTILRRSAPDGGGEDRIGKFLLLTLLILLATGMFLAILKLKEWQGAGEFTLSERYFIYLTPVGIGTVALIAADLLKTFRDDLWMKINLGVVLGGLVIIRGLRTYHELVGLDLY